jgi:hypothetical protein
MIVPPRPPGVFDPKPSAAGNAGICPKAAESEKRLVVAAEKKNSNPAAKNFFIVLLMM